MNCNTTHYRANSSSVPGDPTDELRFADLTPAAAAALALDVWFLALPNGEAAPWVAALASSVLIDLSADHRFSDGWRYGLPELRRAELRGARRIANPGCYATGAQLALAPFLPLAAGVPHVFGISGYSGAGTTPSPRNDAEALRDNIMPYGLVGHTHEREIAHQLGRPVAFMPHVAGFFRGITLTISLELTTALDAAAARARAQQAYVGEPLVAVLDEIPLVRDAGHKQGVALGGFTASPDGKRLAFVATLDNLLKGAATQAVQNLNLACGRAELDGIWGS